MGPSLQGGKKWGKKKASRKNQSLNEQDLELREERQLKLMMYYILANWISILKIREEQRPKERITGRPHLEEGRQLRRDSEGEERGTGFMRAGAACHAHCFCSFLSPFLLCILPSCFYLNSVASFIHSFHPGYNYFSVISICVASDGASSCPWSISWGMTPTVWIPGVISANH